MGAKQRFDGLVAVVTGASSGIGSEIFAKLRDEGGVVFGFDIAAGSQVELLDVRDRAAAQRVVDGIIERTGRIDVLFNVAGVGAEGDVTSNSEEEWQDVLAVNLFGVVNMCRAVIPHMRDAGRGSIVNISSVVAISGFRDRALYSASKGAVSSLTRAMAADHVGDGIRCNVIAPGTVETPWVQRLLENAADPKRYLEMLVARQPLGRLGTPDEVAEAALFLASDDGAFVNAAEFFVDGGIHGIS